MITYNNVINKNQQKPLVGKVAVGAGLLGLAPLGYYYGKGYINDKIIPNINSNINDLKNKTKDLINSTENSSIKDSLSSTVDKINPIPQIYPESSYTRSLGLGTRSVLQGLGDIPSTINQYIANPFLSAADYITGGHVPFRYNDQNSNPGQTLSNMMNLPTPERPSEKVIDSISQLSSSALSGGMLGRGLKSLSGLKSSNIELVNMEPLKNKFQKLLGFKSQQTNIPNMSYSGINSTKDIIKNDMYKIGDLMDIQTSGGLSMIPASNAATVSLTGN